MKMKAILAASLLVASSSAVAGEPVELTANQMDGVTAGAASGLQFNLTAIGENNALTRLQARTRSEALQKTEVQLTDITQTQSAVGATGIAQAM